MEICRFLSELAVHRVPRQQWSGLSTHVQQCVVPARYHSAFQRLQCRWRVYRQWRMAKNDEFADLFRRQRRQELLIPSNCTVLPDPFAWYDLLRPGDHIVVYTDLVYHHGIYVGNRTVIHVVGSCPAIQQCTLNDFVAMAEQREGTYGIVHHIVPDDVDEVLYREATVKYATYCLEHLAATEFYTYDALTNNCEHFVWWVLTGGAVKYSAQAQQISSLLRDDLQRKRGEFGKAHMTVLGVSLAASSRRTCSIM